MSDETERARIAAGAITSSDMARVPPAPVEAEPFALRPGQHETDCGRDHRAGEPCIAYKRPKGCQCDQEEGDSDCPVHPTCWSCGAVPEGCGCSVEVKALQ